MTHLEKLIAESRDRCGIGGQVSEVEKLLEEAWCLVGPGPTHTSNTASVIRRLVAVVKRMKITVEVNAQVVGLENEFQTCLSDCSSLARGDGREK